MPINDSHRIDTSLNAIVNADISDLVKVEKSMKGLASAIQKQFDGLNLTNLLDTVDTLEAKLKSVLANYQDNPYAFSDDVIKLSGALEALDPSRFEQLSSAYRQLIRDAREFDPVLSRRYSANELEGPLQALEQLDSAMQKSGSSARELFDILERGSSDTVWELQDAKSEAEALRSTVDDLQRQLEEAHSESYLQSLHDQIADLEGKVTTFSEGALKEFDTFLQANHLDPESSIFASYRDQIQNGTKSVQDAMQELKTKSAELFQESASSNVTNQDLANIASRLDEIVQKLGEVQLAKENAVNTAVEQRMTESFGEASKEALELGNTLSNVANEGRTSLSGLTEVINALVKALGEMGSGANSGGNAAVGVLERLNEIAGQTPRNLEALAAALQGLAAAKNFKFGTTGMDNLYGLISKAQEIPSDALNSLRQLADIQWTNLQNLKINKGAAESLGVLATTLPKLCKVTNNIESLKQLEALDFSKIQIPENFASFVDALKGLASASVVKNLQAIDQITFDNLNNLHISGTTSKSLASLAAALTGAVEVNKSQSSMDTKAAQFEKSIDSVQAKLVSLERSSINIDPLKTALDDARQKMDAFRAATDTAAKQTAFNELSQAVTNLKTQLSALDGTKKSFAEMDKGIKSISTAMNKLGNAEGVKDIQDAFKTLQERVASFKARVNTGSLIPNSKEADAEVQAIARDMAALQQRIEGVRSAGGDAGKGVAGGMREGQEEAKQLDVTLKGIWDTLGKTTAGKLATTMLSTLTMQVRRLGREVFNNVKEIESSLAQLQVVTGASNSQLDAFFNDAAESAKQYGTEVSAMLDSVTTFSRLGYSLQESLAFSGIATELSNVAAVDVSAGTSGLTSILKAYQLQASDADHIADVLTVVGQKYAISASELMTAFERGGAALAATNTSFEKSAALFAAANAALQNPEGVGTALKTVSARIRGAKSELEDLGETSEDVMEGFSKYRDEIKALTNVDGFGGFDIMADEATNTYKDIYEIFVGISGLWDQLSDTTQARVAEILGGTRQLSVISSIITNIADAEGAYADAMNAAGVAAQANEIVMDTTEKKIEQLKTAFQELSRDILSSDFLKGVVDFGSKVVNVLDNISKETSPLVTLLGSLVAVDIVKHLGKYIALDGCEPIAA